MVVKINKGVLLRLFTPIINLFVDIVNLFIHRDRSIILFGSWMGERFADNSRFLFQYLSKQIENTGFSRVIWVTRNESLLSELKNMGYEAYLMNSKESYYFHFKAGIHIVCNMEFDVHTYRGDIMGQLSGHAYKINLWHGIPIKGGSMANAEKKDESFKRRLLFELKSSRLFNDFFTPGHWNKAYYASTGKECTKRLSLFHGIAISRFIECGYPRNCPTIKYRDSEKRVLLSIKSHTKSVLYLPTFREKSSMNNLLDDSSFVQFLNEQDLFWVEKEHSASSEIMSNKGVINYLKLNSDFDVNTIIDSVDLVITDYSSVAYDAYAFGKAVIYFSPDYESYNKYERGFLCDYLDLSSNALAENAIDLANIIRRYFCDTEYMLLLKDKSNREKRKLYDIPNNYQKITELLLNSNLKG